MSNLFKADFSQLQSKILKIQEQKFMHIYFVDDRCEE